MIWYFAFKNWPINWFWTKSFHQHRSWSFSGQSELYSLILTLCDCLSSLTNPSLQRESYDRRSGRGEQRTDTTSKAAVWLYWKTQKAAGELKILHSGELIFGLLFVESLIFRTHFEVSCNGCSRNWDGWKINQRCPHQPYVFCGLGSGSSKKESPSSGSSSTSKSRSRWGLCRPKEGALFSDVSRGLVSPLLSESWSTHKMGQKRLQKWFKLCMTAVTWWADDQEAENLIQAGFKTMRI